MPPDRRFKLCTGECVPAIRLAEYPDSHIIGELIYIEGRHYKKTITALAIYEDSRITADVPINLPLIRCEAIGDNWKIRCTKCENDRRVKWVVSRAAQLAFKRRAYLHGVADDI